jgi:hypothetical protein
MGGMIVLPAGAPVIPTAWAYFGDASEAKEVRYFAVVFYIISVLLLIYIIGLKLNYLCNPHVFFVVHRFLSSIAQPRLVAGP